MSDSTIITVDIHSFWHAGTGKSGGFDVDALIDRDADQLPRLSGRSLKGLLRDAVAHLRQWGHYDNIETGDFQMDEILFGVSSQNDRQRPRVWPGMLAVSDAVLPQVTRNWILSRESSVIGELTHRLFTTAIDHERGTAKNQTLRGIEVAVPMCLEAVIECTPPAGDHDLALLQRTMRADWVKHLEKALPLIRSVGSQKTRGLGHATLTLGAVAQ